jgi:chromosome segregation ATPase
MGIEEAQQINLLAKELKEHGIACSFDDAYEKAEGMLRKVQNEGEEPDEKLQLLEQRYKFMLNSQNQKFADEIGSLKRTISSLSAELAELKRMVNEQKQEIKTSQEEGKKEVQQKIGDTKEEKGELKPGDISIEKFFYCGEK